MTRAYASAPGKVILLGEHAVVFGHPALAASVRYFVNVEAISAATGGVRIDPPVPADPRIDVALGMLARRLGVIHARVVASSQLPPGGGLGSSGAFGVAAFRALAGLAGASPTTDQVLDAVAETEALFHGRASGVDHATSATGGLLAFWKGPPRRIEPLVAARPLQLVIGLSGRSRATSSHVTSLATRVEGDPARWRPLVDRLGELARLGITAVKAGSLRELGSMMDEAHGLLSACGLSCPELDAIVRAAREAGALGAKLTGAGGGGAAIALVDDPTDVVRAIERAGFEARTATIGGPGVAT